jgi:pilus assembly protein Flp/PilA
MLRKFLGDQTGATAIEYGLIAALVALGLVTALTSIGTSLSGFFDDAKIKVDTAKTP